MLIQGSDGVTAALQRRNFSIASAPATLRAYRGCRSLTLPSLPHVGLPAPHSDTPSGSPGVHAQAGLKIPRCRVCRYAEVNMVRNARLPLASVQNAAGRFTQPDPAHFSLVLPRNATLPEVTGNAWYDLNISASGADPALGSPVVHVLNLKQKDAGYSR